MVTTAGTAITAHLADACYDHQAMIYLLTADRLEGLRNKWLANPNKHDPKVIAEFVDNCSSVEERDVEKPFFL